MAAAVSGVGLTLSTPAAIRFGAQVTGKPIKARIFHGINAATNPFARYHGSVNPHELRLEKALAHYAQGAAPQAHVLRAIDMRALRKVSAITNLGVLWRAAKQPQEAIACYRWALQQGGNYASLWTNLGNALKDLKWMHQARAAHEQAIALEPRSAAAWYNYGIALAADNRFAQALPVFKTAMELPDAERHNSGWELARCLLALGDYAQGWHWYASRWQQPSVRHPYPNVPAWDGSPLGARHLLLWPEQGFGDTLQCLRFLDAVHAQNHAQTHDQDARITVALQPELLRLAQASYPRVHFIAKTDTPPPFDVQAPLLDLPGFFCRSLDAIPQPQGYLRLPAALSQSNPFAALRTQFPHVLRVGVVWSGSVTFAGNADRALAAETLLAQLHLPGVQLFSLQKGPARDQRQNEMPALMQRFGVVDLADQLNDFADTAAAIACLDLVVMTDSSVAHLCGALGAPVWVLLAHHAHWLWLRPASTALDASASSDGTSDDTPDTSAWYHSMRFFRQTAHGDWRSALDPLGAALLRKQREVCALRANLG